MTRPWLTLTAASVAALAAAAAPTVLPNGFGSSAAVDTPAVPPTVEITAPEIRVLPDTAEFLGRIQAVESADIRARVGGVIEEVTFREGDLVREGDPLFRIDPRPYRVQLDQAQAALLRSEEQLELAESRLGRARTLAKKSVVSRDALDAAEAEYATIAADVEAARAAVAAAELNLDFTEIRAPISGRIGAAALTRGNHVVPAAGGPLATIVSVDPVHILFDVDERQFLELLAAKASDPASAELAASVQLLNGDTTGPIGRVDFIDNRVDSGTGTIRVRALLPNPDRRLAPGLFARVTLQIGEPRPVVVIDESVVATDQTSRFVLVVGPDDIVQYRPVELGRTVEPGRRIVLSGLSAGERVLAKGFARPGMQVAPTVTVSSRTLEAEDKP